MNNPQLQTHFYDHKCQKIILLRKNSSDEFIQTLTNYLPKIHNVIAKEAMLLIIRDVGHQDNCDDTKNIWAEDILYEIITHPASKDCQGIIEEQLADIIEYGQCSQGRVTRLLQIYLALMNSV